ncbi:MAG: transport-associated protein [Polyangiaceae bacterium]|jgi:osmotically-inducible protein OsmY|nr:transport-associated protein [Polyangiaceae bacterium]
MNDNFGRSGGNRNDRFRNDPQYTRSREPDGGFWERGEEDRALRSPDQEFETSGNYRQPQEQYVNQGQGSARNGSSSHRNQLTDYSNSSYDRSRFDGRYAPSYPATSSYGRETSSRGLGGHSGRGPKGYTRTDERIREDVCDRLSWNDEVDATDISVRVEKGEVTLEGSVETRHMKRLATDLVEDVPGVLDVHNTIRVQKPILTELKEKITGEAKDEHYANTGTKTTGASPVRNGVT